MILNTKIEHLKFWKNEGKKLFACWNTMTELKREKNLNIKNK